MNSESSHSISSQDLINPGRDQERRKLNDEDHLLSDRPNDIGFDPLVTGEALLSIARLFLNDERITKLHYFENKFGKLIYKLKKHNENREIKGLLPVTIKYLEHAHYIYSFKRGQITEEEQQIVRNRELEFSNDDYPDETVYKWILRLLKVLSLLMVKWGIFDFNQYGYRYKGRSKTVRLLEMKKVNEQALCEDILWFSFAISHQPFIYKISKIMSSYAKVLQFAIDKIIVRLENRSEPLVAVSFDLVSRWQFGKKNDPWVLDLYSELKDLEMAYREFEKHLIEEFLKII